MQRGYRETHRTLRQFVEQEVRLPNGPHKNALWRPEYQPFSALVVDRIDHALATHQWGRIVLTGCTQSGKTTIVVWLLLYILFELHETVIFGIPTMDLAEDKWRDDILPVLQLTRYVRYKPTEGEGSRSGSVKSAIRFRNGATLKFMSGGGGDAKRSGFTSRFVLITEADKLDAAGRTSREGDKVSQLEARADAFGEQALVVMESTPSVSQGRVWRELKSGTDTRIGLPCPHCGECVTPEREQFKGWQGADSDTEARDLGHFVCPACGVVWSEQDRHAANREAVLLDRGQVGLRGADGVVEVVGDSPATRTCGIRWSAVNNLFWTQALIAEREWASENKPAVAEAQAERVPEQFRWARPADPPKIDLSGLSWLTLTKRQHDQARGQLPPDSVAFALGTDVGDRLLHWDAGVRLADGSPRLIDNGVIEVDKDGLGLQRALRVALGHLFDMCGQGWPLGEKLVQPGVVLIDSGAGDHTATVYEFVREHGEPFRALKGYGTRQARRYARPRSTGNQIVAIEPGYHVVALRADGVLLFEVDADHWKGAVHDALRIPTKEPGALLIFQDDPREHTKWAHHITAERQVQQYVAGKGFVMTWEEVQRRPNHHLDATAYCLAGLAMAPQLNAAPPPPRQRKRTGLATPDGRPFLATDRR